MNFKQFGALLSISTIVGINLIANQVLAQDGPTITFGSAIASGGCSIDKQLPGPNARSISISLNNMRATNGQRQRCILRVNTTIPPGFFVQAVEVIYQGTVTVLPRSRGVTFNRNYSFLGGALGTTTSGPGRTEYRSIADNEFFTEQDDLAVLSASCGGRGTFGINMIAQSSQGSDWILDTTDINAGASADLTLIFGITPC
ncbi:DUF4360 domain-containing protein [Nostoc sp. FACHB-152]|uniref:DUF4360 domain-containing protein n=1 Tax=unclassified Nostoc TaxID=2593658 RepID=UPI00168268A5|nr:MULTISPECIES: DUF4360 domain-containing protein [unclassified Nostoc]MBD2446678.1 DUF4360 domain-containing protein [Nostoc sp. FACHB-152]MBD2466526.1 DUF4360 domain-containing protein [Nostoc sp. FACHB-145]